MDGAGVGTTVGIVGVIVGVFVVGSKDGLTVGRLVFEGLAVFVNEGRPV